MTPLRIAIIGYGKIARDQHAPAIAADPRFELAATVARGSPGAAGLPCFASHAELLAQMPDLDAVAICTPPSARYEIARATIEAGLHTLLEKPPGVTLGEVEELARLAGEKKVSLFAAWHARHNPAVEAAADFLRARPMRSMRIVWREDVRKWHPGQQWIWQPGGFGVFDPGINAFSIATRIFPGALLVRKSRLFVPENKQSPIAAALEFASPAASGPLSCALDWRHGGEDAWTIEVETADGASLLLSEGGKRLTIDRRDAPAAGPGEYPALYEHFGALIGSGGLDVDIAPLRLAADAFLLGERSAVEAFED